MNQIPVSIAEPSAWRRAAMIVPVVTIIAMVLNGLVIQRFPNSGDEYAYTWQATAFASGHIIAHSPEPAEAFRVNHIGDIEGERFCKYPPGWPLLLAAGVRLQVPGAVNPLLAALALAGIYRLCCSWVSAGAASAGILFVGSSPFFLLNAASYYSHPSCLFALTGMALALAWSTERHSGAAAAIAGFAWGLAVLIRPFTACLIGLPFILSALRQWRVRDVCLFGVGGLPTAAVLMLINWHVTGTWFTLAWSRFDASEGLGFGVYGHTPWRGIKTAIRLLLEGALTTGLVAPLLAIVTVIRRTPRRGLLWASFATLVIGHVFWWSDGGNRYGPRFYFEALLPFTMLAGSGFEQLRSHPSVRRAVVVSAIALGAIVSVTDYRAVHEQIARRRDVYRTVERAQLQGALIFLETASADMVRIDLTRNPPDFGRAPVLYALSLGSSSDDVVRRQFPNRTPYWYRWSAEGGRLSQTPPR